MGMFSFIGDILGDIMGTNQAGEAAQEASEQSLAFQEKGLDYLKSVQEKPLDYRDQALDELGGFYGLGDGDSQALIDRTRASPMYESMRDVGRQGVGSALSATGDLRTGSAKEAFYQQDQNTLSSLVNQQLQGLGSFAGTPIDTSGIQNTYSNMGDIKAGGTLAKGRSAQDAFGMALDLGKAAMMI